MKIPDYALPRTTIVIEAGSSGVREPKPCEDAVVPVYDMANAYLSLSLNDCITIVLFNSTGLPATAGVEIWLSKTGLSFCVISMPGSVLSLRTKAR